MLRRIWKNVGILLGATSISMVLGFATVALNARALGPKGLGIITLFQAAAAILIGVFQFGSQQPMIRLGRQALEEGRNDRVGVIAGLAVILDTVAALSAGLFALTLIWLVPELIRLPKEMHRLAQVYTIVIFFSGVGAANGILRLLDRFHFLGFIQIANALVIFAAAAILFLRNAAIEPYVLAYAVINATSAGAQVAIALYLLRSNGIRIRFSAHAIGEAGIQREYFAYAWTTSLTGTFDSIRRNADALLLGVFAGPVVVGIYSVVKQLSGVFNKVLGPISSAVFPEVAALAATDNRLQARRLLQRLAIVGLAVGAIAVLVLAISGGVILDRGFGKAFGQAYYALLAMMVAVSLNLSSASFGGFVQAFVSPKKLLHVYTLALFIYILVAPLLIYSMGLLGSALGQIVFALTMWICCWRVLELALTRPVL